MRSAVPATAGKTTIKLDDLPGMVGRRLGTSAWLPIEREVIDQFGVTTRDHQWIHVDPARATEGPFGATIAHGYLVLSLCSLFLVEALEVTDAETVINYGLDRVRFPSPVQVGGRLRGQVCLGLYRGPATGFAPPSK
jgi:acyl dehydratase